MNQGSIKVDGNTNVTVNEYGNISKVITTNVISDLPVEHEHTFYYRIEKEAGVSGEAPVYSQVQIRHENPMDEKTLIWAHKVFYRKQLSEEHAIALQHITPISQEQYEQAMNG